MKVVSCSGEGLEEASLCTVTGTASQVAAARSMIQARAMNPASVAARNRATCGVPHLWQESLFSRLTERLEGEDEEPTAPPRRNAHAPALASPRSTSSFSSHGATIATSTVASSLAATMEGADPDGGGDEMYVKLSMRLPVAFIGVVLGSQVREPHAAAATSQGAARCHAASTRPLRFRPRPRVARFTDSS